MYEVEIKENRFEKWEQMVENIEKEKISSDVKSEEYNPSDIDSDWENDDNLEALETEMNELKDLEKYFDHTKPKIIEVSQARVWIEIAKEMKWKSPELYDVIVLLLCIPNGTSELERIFSVIKAMKSKKRSKLKARKLAKMITIYYFFDLENYDKEELCNIFQEMMR